MEAVIRTFALAKAYGGRRALRGIDLEVPHGVIFGYLGPNGAGKTTTIRLLAGLLRPTAGRAEVLGHDVVTDREGVRRAARFGPTGELRLAPGRRRRLRRGSAAYLRAPGHRGALTTLER